MAQAVSGSHLVPFFLRAMWRAAGVSYLRYTNEMATILRQCLREPYREKALQKDATHLVEKIWVNGTVQTKTLIDDMSKGFESGAGSGEVKK
mmetsp:Transcript_14149/g.24872  ORF Transcript_14149/g.24872 Transcript_14149/m.24872 type:complete len:92 (+) Transcript_14149:2-277(+)